MLNKVLISYFYQIRFFKPNFVPLSTALWDPKWYHDFRDQEHVFKDRNGVVNGLRFRPFIPRGEYSDKCRGPENQIACEGDPYKCEYLSGYYKQLCKYNISDLLDSVDKVLISVKDIVRTNDILIPVFIVHEAPTKECSERLPLFNYFVNNGIDVDEYNKNKM